MSLRAALLGLAVKKSPARQGGIASQRPAFSASGELLIIAFPSYRKKAEICVFSIMSNSHYGFSPSADGAD